MSHDVTTLFVDTVLSVSSRWSLFHQEQHVHCGNEETARGICINQPVIDLPVTAADLKGLVGFFHADVVDVRCLRPSAAGSHGSGGGRFP